MSIYEYRPLLYYCAALALCLGASLGSFLNCAAWRIAHGESFVKGRSRCPACGHTLGPPDLVPVFSWLFLRGKCRYCGERISPRYVLAELLFAALTLACLLRFDLGVECLRNLVFLCCLFCLSLVDLEIWEIPDGCLLVAAAVWLAALPFLWQGWWPALSHVLCGVLVGGGVLLLSLVMDRMLQKESMGGGDIKLFALVGLYLGFYRTVFTLLLSCVLGLLFVLISRRGRGKPFPFGPAISAAAAVLLLWGDGIVDWYLGLFLR